VGRKEGLVGSVRLYYWDTVEALADHAPGIAFAFADSKEQAVELVMDAFGEYSKLRLELTGTEPTVYEGPHGFYVMGSA
jgi:hypothetical protein